MTKIDKITYTIDEAGFSIMEFAVREKYTQAVVEHIEHRNQSNHRSQFDNLSWGVMQLQNRKERVLNSVGISLSCARVFHGKSFTIGHQIRSIEEFQWIPRIVDDSQHASD